MYNRVTLIGRWVKSPELRYSQSGTAILTCTLAVDRRKKEDGADFIPIVAYQKTAENTANYTDKGSLICVEGRIQVRSYDAKDGSGRRYATEVVAEQVKFLNKRGAGDTNGGKEEIGQEVEFTDDEIPF